MKIVITGPFDEEIVEDLCQRGYKITRLDADVSTKQLVSALVDADAYLFGGNERLTSDVVGGAKRLRVIVFLGEQPETFMNAGVGDLLKQREILLRSTPGVSTNAVAEMACALIFCSLRRIPYLAAQTSAMQWPSYTGSELAGKTIGIYGMGRIGYTVVERLVGFDLEHVLYSDVVRSEHAEADFGAEQVELNELFVGSDVISLHAPLTPDTEGIVGENLLKLMRPWAILVNTARPAIVDPHTLRTALCEEWLASAAFDGYYVEGEEFMRLTPETDPYGLISMTDRFILTSHQGFNTLDAVRNAGESASRILTEVLGQ